MNSIPTGTLSSVELPEAFPNCRLGTSFCHLSGDHSRWLCAEWQQRDVGSPELKLDAKYWAAHESTLPLSNFWFAAVRFVMAGRILKKVQRFKAYPNGRVTRSSGQ